MLVFLLACYLFYKNISLENIEVKYSNANFNYHNNDYNTENSSLTIYNNAYVLSLRICQTWVSIFVSFYIWGLSDIELR